MAGFSGFIPALLAALKAPNTPQNRLFLQAWQRAEGGSASFNPFNTTQGESGASNYNSVGVKNYGNASQGAKATVETLLNGRYGNIVGDLRSGKATAVQLATDVEHSPWGTGSGVLRVLGSGPVEGPKNAAWGTPGQPRPRPGGAAPTGLAGKNPANQLLSEFLLSQAQQQLSGGNDANFGSGGLLQLALARKALSAAGTSPRASAKAQVQTSKPIPIESLGSLDSIYQGDIQGEKSSLLNKIADAAKAVGATHIRVTSGFRSAQHNAAVGGVAHSNHTTGDAMDGDAFIPGRGWVPLGVALQPVVSKFGLRSGNVPGFFNGGPDPVHVDDGANVS